jgi:hypothetical protein
MSRGKEDRCEDYLGVEASRRDETAAARQNPSRVEPSRRGVLDFPDCTYWAELSWAKTQFAPGSILGLAAQSSRSDTKLCFGCIHVARCSVTRKKYV